VARAVPKSGAVIVLKRTPSGNFREAYYFKDGKRQRF
jgi:hypothetical protein